jgi:hypothetical protein
MRILNPREEAATLLEYHRGEHSMASSMAVLSHQFQVIQARSQLLLSLAALVLTITGFSGPKIAATNSATRALMICGIVLDVVSIGVLLIQSLKVRWSTQIRGASDLETLELIILNRNKKTTHYFVALVLLVLALGSYIGSVALYLVCFPSA